MSAIQVYNKANLLKFEAGATPIERQLAACVCELATEITALQDELAKIKGRPNPPKNLAEGK